MYTHNNLTTPHHTSLLNPSNHHQVPNIPSLIYFCRRNPGEPYISPKVRSTSYLNKQR